MSNLDSSNNVYVIGSLPSKIQKFSSTGKLLLSWDLPAQFLGVSKTGEIYLYNSNDAYVEKYVSNSTIVQYSSNPMMPKTIQTVPEFGPIIGLITLIAIIGSISISRKFLSLAIRF